jgi:hypothetical protein
MSTITPIAPIEPASFALPGHQRLPEPDLVFHPERIQDRHAHPLRGLLDFGPYSRSLINPVLDPIRIATLAPHGEGRRLHGLIKELGAEHRPGERKTYLPPWPGFSEVFGLRAVAAERDSAHVELPAELDHDLAASNQPHALLASTLTRALRSFTSAGLDYDLLLILLPDRWSDAFYGGEHDNFDLHDFVKAQLAMINLPSQVVNDGRSSALSYFCRASVAWRIGLALYCKAGGVPWKLADAEPEVAHIGLSYALRPHAENGERFLTCCSQVFDADGAGLEFVAYETAEYRIFGSNPYLSREAMRRVMARSLVLYQNRHAGRAPRRVIVHKTTEFKPREVEGVFDALGNLATIDLLQIKDDSGWRGLRIDRPRNPRDSRGEPASYPLERGTLLPLGGSDALLWTAGDTPEVANGKHYFKEGKGVPTPLMLVRHAGRGGWEDTTSAVLGLTKMNWNNDALYDRLPVTLGFAATLAKTVIHMDRLGPRPYPVRLFM